MSTQIYYEHVIVRIPGNLIVAKEDQFMQLTLDGSSNTYCGDRRVRKWHLQGFGTYEEIMAGAISHGRYFEGGMSAWKSMGASGHLTAQQWIRKVRLALDKAKEWNPDLWGIPTSVNSNVRITGRGELQGLDQAAIVRELYAMSIDESRDLTKWPTYFDHVKVDGPGEI